MRYNPAVQCIDTRFQSDNVWESVEWMPVKDRCGAVAYLSIVPRSAAASQCRVRVKSPCLLCCAM